MPPVEQKSGSKTIAVLGAGCAGLAAGIRLLNKGHRVVLFEREDHVGGLAGGVMIKGNTYEYGPHAFHTTDPEILNDIKSIMGKDLIEYKRTIKIKFMGNYFQFPLTMKDVLLKLPPLTVIRAGFSFVWHFLVGHLFPPAVENSETILKRFYGNVLYEIFFKSYIIRVWGISPAEFSPSFAQERIPRLNFMGFVDKLASMMPWKHAKKIDTKNFVEKVEGSLYTTKQGFSMITQRMADRIAAAGGTIHLRTKVEKIRRTGEKCDVVVYRKNDSQEELRCDGIINTLPVNLAVRMIQPSLSSEVIEAAEALKFRALVFVGIVVSRDTVLPSSFMYFRHHTFNRISDLAQFGFEIKPKGSTILVAEISCNVGDQCWVDEEHARKTVVKELISEKLIESGEVKETYVFKAEHAYPIYTLNYEKSREILLNAFDRSANIETAGRQGRFQYINTHVAMKMGYEAADRLCEKLKNQ